jgi:RNA polymerase sigma-B factor
MAAYGPAEERDSRPRGDGDEELLELIRQRPGDDPERRKACEILVGRYENIVRSCVRQYRNAPEPAEDLMQVGYIGLMKAINNYDPAFGQGLAAYAQPCVSGEIKRHFRDKRWQIRVQRPVQELRLRIRAAVPDLTHQLSRSPTDAELAVHLGVTEADVTAAQLASQVFQIASLDAPVGADSSGDTAGDLLGAEDPELEHALDMEAVWTHYEELPAREQRLLIMRFYGNMTQAQIGQQLGMSQMHVSRLLGRALAYLREKVTGLSEPLSE